MDMGVRNVGTPAEKRKKAPRNRSVYCSLARRRGSAFKHDVRTRIMIGLDFEYPINLAGAIVVVVARAGVRPAGKENSVWESEK